MDPFTHALSGAVANRAFSPARQAEGVVSTRFRPRERLLLGGAAALWPDIDWLIRLFADELVYLNLHRGLTHSLLLLPFWALLLGYLVARFWPRQRDWREAALIVGIGIGIHILGDFITSYGTQLFAPLSAQALAFPSTFIIDPWITLILLCTVVWAWFGGTRGSARIGLGLVVALVLFQGGMKLQALQYGQQTARALSIHPAQVHALPQPLSPLHWRLIIETDRGHHEAHLGFLRPETPAAPVQSVLRGHWQAFRPADALEWQYHSRFGLPHQTEFARQAWWRPEFAGFRQFAGLPYLWAMDTQDDVRCAVFSDLRFRTEGMPPPFRFAMCLGPDGQWQLHRVGQW